jgi:hypothetical protein
VERESSDREISSLKIGGLKRSVKTRDTAVERRSSQVRDGSEMSRLCSVIFQPLEMQ